MKNQIFLQSPKVKSLFLTGFVFMLFIFSQVTTAQNYRNPKAYILDFGKNELFVKEALMEYSASIVNANLEERVATNLERIYIKLAEENVNLKQNDHGIAGDLDLRNSFIHLNEETIKLLQNKSLKLNDYQLQSALDYPDIIKNFAYKELGIKNYYAEIIKYENNKKEFGLKYNIIIRYFKQKNIFEYDAYQNFIFYRLNVLDEKLMNLIKSKDIEEVNHCLDYITQIGNESLLRTESYKDDFTDTSLNDANIEFIQFIMKQKEELIPLYITYVQTAENFKILKRKMEDATTGISIEDYNTEVRKYNKTKNDFSDTLYSIQIKKRDLLIQWYISNSNFLKHNIEFENLYEKFSNLD